MPCKSATWNINDADWTRSYSCRSQLQPVDQTEAQLDSFCLRAEAMVSLLKVRIIRQSRRLYGCRPLKRGLSATNERPKQPQPGYQTMGFGKARATAGAILPEFSKLGVD